MFTSTRQYCCNNKRTISLLCHRVAVVYILWVVYTNITDVCHTEGGTRLRVFENRVLKRILWPKRDGVTVEW